MELTSKEMKFLTIMNETRLDNGKMFKSEFERINKKFSFTDKELTSAVKKLTSNGLLSTIEVGGDEVVYFHTEKVSKDLLDKDLSRFRR